MAVYINGVGADAKRADHFFLHAAELSHRWAFFICKTNL